MGQAKAAFQRWLEEQPHEPENQPMPVVTIEIEPYSTAPLPEYWKWILFEDGRQVDCGLARSESLARSAADHARQLWEEDRDEQVDDPTDVYEETEIKSPEAMYEVPEIGGES